MGGALWGLFDQGAKYARFAPGAELPCSQCLTGRAVMNGWILWAPEAAGC